MNPSKLPETKSNASTEGSKGGASPKLRLERGAVRVLRVKSHARTGTLGHWFTGSVMGCTP